ncbi:DUF6207 family protein [Streptomyces sp. NPDC050416]|uniref:DUF6207 family protein n=1 Tax=Streptomyces sp. NPDC050416 TaxID=3365611 RepID=UPI00379112D2
MGTCARRSSVRRDTGADAARGGPPGPRCGLLGSRSQQVVRLKAAHEAHVSRSGLVVVDVAVADDATAFAFQSLLADRTATATEENTTRDAGEPGVRLHCYVDLRRPIGPDVVSAQPHHTGWRRAVTRRTVKKMASPRRHAGCRLRHPPQHSGASGRQHRSGHGAAVSRPHRSRLTLPTGSGSSRQVAADVLLGAARAGDGGAVLVPAVRARSVLTPHGAGGFALLVRDA